MAINRIKISENFELREFECRCCGQVKVDRELVEKLQEMRTTLGRPIVITSGYRCPEHNSLVGGAARSQHMTGRAADISLNNHEISGDEMAELAAKVGFRGIGLYESPMLHVDTRQIAARWDWR